MRGEQYPPKLPQGAVCRQWFLPKNVQNGAPNTPALQPIDQRLVVDQRTARDVDDDRILRQQVETRSRHQTSRLRSEWRRKHDDVVVGQLCVEFIEAYH